MARDLTGEPAQNCTGMVEGKEGLCMYNTDIDTNSGIRMQSAYRFYRNVVKIIHFLNFFFVWNFIQCNAGAMFLDLARTILTNCNN